MKYNKLKHSEYPDLVLKALVEEYDSSVDARSGGTSWTFLCLKSALMDDYTKKTKDGKEDKESYDSRFFQEMDEVIRILKNEEYIDTLGSGIDTIFKPTYKGIARARHLLRPWYKKVWDIAKGDLRTIIVAIITAIITALVTALIYNLIF